MLYDEDDIDFLKLSDSDFEEVCFDLLLRLGYKSLVWRLGGADNGRDIEGQFAVSNSLTGTYDEKWFFECKRYEAGIPPEQMNSKFAWADAEKPKHLVFLVSSYLTNNARTWLEKISADKAYKVHLVEGKQLKLLLLSFLTLYPNTSWTNMRNCFWQAEAVGWYTTSFQILKQYCFYSLILILTNLTSMNWPSYTVQQQ